MDGQMDAVKEVIRMKKEYSDSNGVGYSKSESGQKLASSASNLRKQYGVDENRYGADVSLADALTNYMQDFGGASQGGGQPNQSSQPQFNRDEYMNNYKDTMQQSSQAGFESQKAQFDKMLSQQITDLEMAFKEAVHNGELSVRDAQSQFEAQKAQIEQSAYEQSQATKAYGNEMGIGHSQQMVGLQQGDNARTNQFNNSNATDRDKRVNDIRDRISMLGQQKDLQIAQANSDYGYNIAGAQAQANQQYTQGMADLMGKDYFAQMDMGHQKDMASLQQQYNQQNMSTQQGYTKENMGIEQGYKQDNMKIEFENRFKELSEQSRLRINEMTVGHGFDMKKMEQSLKDAIQLEGVKYGHSASLNAQQNNARMKEISSNAMKAIEAEQRQYDLAVKRESSKYNPKTPEGQIFLNQKNAKISDIMSMSILEAEMGSVFNNPALENKPTAPKSYTDKTPLGKFDPVGSSLNALTGYNKKNTSYQAENDAYLEAVRRKEELMNKYK